MKLFGLERELPPDLRPSVGESALAELARAAAQHVAAEKLQLHGPAGADPKAQKLLALLAYCYAAGIHGSQEVEQAGHNDPVVRSLCPAMVPDWAAIWRFRNANRPWIEECLARVYTAICRAPGATDLASEVPHEVTVFARRKLRRATWTDAAVFEGAAPG